MKNYVKSFVIIILFKFKKIIGFSKFYLKYLKCFFGDIRKLEYSFSFQERYLGARLYMYGYPNKTKEIYSSFDNNFDSVKLADYSLFVSKKIFRPGELSHIYDETFYPWPKNPHSYETDFIGLKEGDIVWGM